MDVLMGLDPAWTEALLWTAGGLLASMLSVFVSRRFLSDWAERTRSDIDDVMLEVMKTPVALSCALYGLHEGVFLVLRSAATLGLLQSLYESVLIVVWGRVLLRLGSTVLNRAAHANVGVGRLVKPQTLPIFDFALQIASYLLLGYLMLSAWGIDPTAVLASLGIAGLAFGLAAQQSLGDMFAGVIIIADNPYRIGDFLTLNNGVRGRVMRIGIRSTRLLTPQQVEVVVPNSVMASATIINESGGPRPRQRVDIDVGVAYGTDVDTVKEVVIAAALTVPGVVQDDESRPRVRLVGFGPSSVDYKLLVWGDVPAHRDDLVDAVNVAVYNALNAHGIEIPFPQRDVHLRWPADAAAAAQAMAMGPGPVAGPSSD